MHKIITPQDWKTSNWSGGKTSELYIYPEGAEFKKGDYSLRISIATVEIEESTFTPLKNVDRVLTVLDGEIELIHEGHHSSKLKQYEQDRFSGDWKTASFGKVRDFNVMTKNYAVETKVVKLIKNETFFLPKGSLCFVAEGEIKIDSQKLNKDFLVKVDFESKIHSTMKSVLIVIS